MNIRADEGSTTHDHVEPGNNTWNNNAVEEVCRSADALDLQVLVRDAQVERRFMGERIMLHPESTDDFATHGNYTPENHGAFRQFVLDDSPFTTTLAQRIGGLNCIYMQNDAGTVSGMTVDRIQEMSAYLENDPEDPHRLSGLYHVSVIILPRTDPGFPLPNDDGTPVLNVTISYTDPTTGYEEHVFPLEGRQLWEGAPGSRTRLTGVQEIVLGEIEVRQTNGSPGVIFVDEQTDPVHQARWNRDGINDVRGPRRLREHHEAGILAMRGDFDIQVSYGTDDVHLWLDAVCLTNPATFGLWHGDNPVLDVHDGYRLAMDTRLDFLCRNNDPALAGVGGIPGLRFVMGAEQVFNNGTYWTTFLLSRLIAAETGNNVQMFSTYGSWTNTTLTPILAAEMITGPYNYPILTDHHRPTLQGVTPQNYLPPLYDKGSAPDGFRGMWDLFLPNIHTRSLYAPDQPWIPYIQNHTNLLTTNPPAGWWDGIPNREPSASELRFQCNTALAFGASGVLFYSFSSVPYTPVLPTTPPTVVAADRILPNPGAGVDWFDNIDIDAGTTGFLGSEGVEEARRTLDWNGENKWDSTQAYIDDFLRPAGSYISQHLQWQRGLQWYCRDQNGAGSSELVSMIVSRRQDMPDGIDPQSQTYVMISEFDRRAANPPPGSTDASRFLFVLNGNTYDGPLHAGTHPVGQRHITVKLDTREGQVVEWRVTNIFTNDVWIVRANDAPDESSYANGFTEYFAPGAAALYRLDPISNEEWNDPSACLSGQLYIEPAATLRTDPTDVLSFQLGRGIHVDGMLQAVGTTFQGCTPEGWEGIIGRNSGSVDLEQVIILNAGVIAGSGATVTLDEACQIIDTEVALTNVGGTIESTSTLSTGVKNHLYSVGNGANRLIRDQSTGGSYTLSTALDVESNSQITLLDECAFSGFWRGLCLEDADLWGDADNAFPADGGNNSIHASNLGITAYGGAVVDLGSIKVSPSWEALNEIVLSYPTGYHALTDASSMILARQCWWEPVNNSQIPGINISGNVEYMVMLNSDPIPFAGDGGGSTLTKAGTLSSLQSTPPPNTVREQIKATAVQGNPTLIRSLIGQFLASSQSATVDVPTLRFLHHTLRDVGGRGNIDSLLALCLSRSDISSKLLAADIAMEDSLFDDALDILNAYSFAGSGALSKQGLIRKAILHPLAYPGGYRNGLDVLDSLRSLNDSTLLRFLDLYPVLFSGLSTPEPSTTPKASRIGLIERNMPKDITLWPNYPNPFRDVTSFTFKLGKATHVRLTVHDAMGREVAVLTDADYTRGVHSVMLQSTQLPSGLYFYRFMSDEGVIQRKMLLVR